MKFVTVGNGRVYEVPETWAEAEKILKHAMADHKVGCNLRVQSACARVAYGMFGARWMAADPTEALGYLMMKICQHKGAGLE